MVFHMTISASSGGAADSHRFPTPVTAGRASLEECIAKRRSVRAYRSAPLSLAEVGQLLWAAQGITAEDYLRAAPSAGALYPMETYVVAGDVQTLPAGVYQCRPERHDIVPIKSGDVRPELAQAAIGQESVAYAPLSIVFAADYGRTTKKYGQRGLRYIYMEAGHAAENVYLQATALGLGTVAVGAFRDAEIKRIVGLPSDQEPLYLMPIGRPRP